MINLLCSVCNKEKPSTEFFKEKCTRGHSYKCKDCRREYKSNLRVSNGLPPIRIRDIPIIRSRKVPYPTGSKEYLRDTYLWRHYRITLEDFNKRLESQGHKCYICHRAEPTSKGWCMDHNHETGALRKILCHHCNTGLGAFSENPELLIKAIHYLKHHNDE